MSHDLQLTQIGNVRYWWKMDVANRGEHTQAGAMNSIDRAPHAQQDHYSSDSNDDLLLRLESEAARIYAWIEEHDGLDMAKPERYRVEADLYIEAAKRIRHLEAKTERERVR